EQAGLYGYIASGYWRDIGNLMEYHDAHLDAVSKRVSLEIAGTASNNAIIDEGSVTEGAEFYGLNIIGKNVTIARGAKLVNSVIGNDTVISAGAAIEDAVLWNNIQ